MRGKRGISPLVATLVLIVASLALGGLLFTQFRSLVAAGASTAYIDIVDYSISSDGKTLTLTVKNTGNEPITITKIDLGSYGSYTSSSSGVAFYPENANWKLMPGEVGVIKITKSTGSFPTSGELTVVIVGDKFSRGFTLPL